MTSGERFSCPESNFCLMFSLPLVITLWCMKTQTNKEWTLLIMEIDPTAHPNAPTERERRFL
jgi:hypothetical protein